MAHQLTGKTIASTFEQLFYRGTSEPGATNDAEYILTSQNDQTDDITTALAVGTARVGIGTDAPNYGLHVSSTASTSIGISDSDYAGHGSSWYFKNDGGLFQLISADQDFSSSTARISVQNDGNVGIGTDSPTSSLHILTAETGDSGASPHALHVEQEGGAEAGDTLVRLDFNADPDVSASGNLAKYISFHDSNNDEIGYIGAASATTMTTTIVGSDVRLKTDIKDTSLNGLSIINAIKIRDFKWGDKAAKGRTGKQVIGKFVADEVYEVFPNASWGKPGQMKDIKDKDGNKTGEEIFPMGVSEGEFIAPMMKAIQELSAKVEALENA